RGVEVVGGTDLGGGVVPLVAAAVDRQGQRQRVEPAEEVGAATAALHGRREHEALVERFPALGGGTVAAEEDRGAVHGIGFRSGWGERDGGGAPRPGCPSWGAGGGASGGRPSVPRTGGGCHGGRGDRWASTDGCESG